MNSLAKQGSANDKCCDVYAAKIVITGVTKVDVDI